MSTRAITELHAALRKRGTDLGAAQGDEQAAGYGGRFQVYERGRIYWHPSTGAHELRGRLLQRYLQAGGHDVNPATGERELGFPSSGHVPTEDGRYDCATFEWGIIADVSGTALVRLFGPLHAAWRAEGGALGRLGHPLDDVKPLEGGRAAWFERGVLWHADGSRDLLVGELVPPTPGQPALVDPANPGSFEWMSFDGAAGALDSRPGLAAALMRGRLSLAPVGGGAPLDLVPAAATTARDGARWLAFTVPAPFGGRGGRFAHIRDAVGGLRDVVVDGRVDGTPGTGGGPATPARPRGLVRRQLYSLAFRTPGLGPRVVSPHCLYARSDWENFGIAHVTDVHVSRRIDHYRATLRAAGVPEEDVARLNNWNDAFRDFIRYANHLHAAGLLDVVIATGDIVDYVREVDDHPQGPGNFGFLEALLQGQAKGDAQSPASEPLRVPIFTSLGNHDYRPLPYALGWDLEVRSGDLLGAIPGVGGLLSSLADGVDGLLGKVPGLGIVSQADIVGLVSSFGDTMWNHQGLNTTHQEALRLMGMAFNGTYYAPKLRPAAAAKAVIPDRAMRDGSHYYFRRINPSRSYVVRLGAHRVVMIDTRWDEGITDDVSEAMLTKLGFGSESQENFQAATPDSVGATAADVGMLRGALAEAGAAGLVIVGMHAPPLNPAGTDLSNCLRETAHPTADASQVTGWLMRKAPLKFLGSPPHPGGAPFPLPDAHAKHPGWVRTGTPHFHEGAVEDFLDEGIAVGQQEPLARAIAGEGAPRPVTMLCCGHGHTRVEYRLTLHGGQLRAFTDHYLSNPATYYRSYLVDGEWWKPQNHKRYLTRLQGNAPAAGEVQHIEDHRGNIWTDRSELRVPPYAAPLAEAADPAAWWQAHAPVVVQTAALGPCTNTRAALEVNKIVPSPNFQGFRLMQIVNNVIAKVHYVAMPDLRGAAFPLPWEAGVGPAGPTPPVTPPPVAGGTVRETAGAGGRVIRDHRGGGTR